MQQEKRQNPAVLRVALYIRVSTEEQAINGDSLAAQEDDVRRFAQEHGMKIVGIYRDEGNSARKPAMKRPVMLELLEDVKAGKIDLILFTKLDRWFRNVREYHKIQEVLEQHGVAWQATLESYDTSSADGRFKLNILLSVAEQEADRTSERLKFINQSKLRRKEARTGIVSYGYKVEQVNGAKRVVKDPETEPLVQDFWDHYRKYESIKLAGNFVNQKYGIKRTYKAWSTTAKSEMHTGNWLGVEDYCPAYISPKDWKRLQECRNVKTSPNPNRVYLFTGLVICPGCGRHLTGITTRHKRPDGKSAEWQNYRCHDRRMNVCPAPATISEKKLETMLLNRLRQELESFILAAEVREQSHAKKSKAHDIAKLNEQMRRLNRIFMAGNIDDDEYAAQTVDLKKKIALAKEEEKDERPPDLEVLREFLKSDFETIYHTLDNEDKRRLWRSIIKEIHISKGNIEHITFRA